MAPFIVVLEGAQRLMRRRGSGKLRCQGHSERFRELVETILCRNLLQSPKGSCVRSAITFITDNGGDPEPQPVCELLLG